MIPTSSCCCSLEKERAKALSVPFFFKRRFAKGLTSGALAADTADTALASETCRAIGDQLCSPALGSTAKDTEPRWTLDLLSAPDVYMEARRILILDRLCAFPRPGETGAVDDM